VSERFSDTKSLKDSIERQQATIIDNPEIEPSQKLLFGSFFGSVTAMLENLDTLPDQESDDPATNRPMAGGFNFVNIQPIDVSQQIDPNSVGGQLKKIRSQWDISFPQAMMWGVLGCVAGFSISIARERSQGTMVRLLCAPVSRFEILAGKALACFLAVVAVITLLTVLGMLLGMKPASLLWLAVAALCVATCFVGIMMTMSLLGKTEQSVAGAGWAINMVMAMLGGAMIPVMFMPSVVQQFSILSPIKWGILALEGAIWRQFTWNEMLLPCSVLLMVGAIGFFVGMTLLKRSD
jgi:ABC-2 type transport system permease protein